MLAQRFRDELARLERRSRLRSSGRLDAGEFFSNDYLGIASHPAMHAAAMQAAQAMLPVGSGGSRLLAGNHGEHLEAERRFAAFIGRERSLLFGSGYLANLAVLSALPGRHDLLVLDAAAHASLKEGARASLAARRTFRHNDPDWLRRSLQDRERYACAFVVVEGVYSMDGDLAPLAEMAEVCAELDAHLIVDEAHATGLFGAGLRGVHALYPQLPPPLLTIHPCGKAMGCSGAFVAADALTIDYLVNTARPFLFSTSASPFHAHLLSASINLIAELHDRAAAVLERASRLRARLEGLRRWSTVRSPGPIVPLIVGDDASAVRASRHLRERYGITVPPIRPPTVPEGSSRLRITVTWGAGEERLDYLADALLATEDECGGEDEE
ncbi:MAG TPA: 8-amino-7-oxononanoate synthase [Candidatus Kapabacteria bacterium]|nr:8-amino-7-oxononanoate synthase [Candidatus Kapabacteria bacterium]